MKLKIPEMDLKLKLISGSPIKVDDRAGAITPLKLQEVVDYGYMNYLKSLNALSANMEDIFGEETETVKQVGITMFDILVLRGGDEVRKEIENAFSLFYREKHVMTIEKAGIIVIGGGENSLMIDRENFDEVREVIKWQNCVNTFSKDEEDKELNPANDMVKEIQEKLERARKMVQKYKQEDDEGKDTIDLHDIISSVSSMSNSVNKLNIFNLTMYQLYDEFKRLEHIEQYDLSVKSLLAGAKNVKMKHWSGKLD